jgi:hypothetical protein
MNQTLIIIVAVIIAFFLYKTYMANTNEAFYRLHRNQGLHEYGLDHNHGHSYPHFQGHSHAQHEPAHGHPGHYCGNHCRHYKD